MNSHRTCLDGFGWALRVVATLALALPIAATEAAECSLTMGVEDWPPYLFRDSQGKPTGIDVEIIRAVVARAVWTGDTRGTRP